MEIFQFGLISVCDLGFKSAVIVCVKVFLAFSEIMMWRDLIGWRKTSMWRDLIGWRKTLVLRQLWTQFILKLVLAAMVYHIWNREVQEFTMAMLTSEEAILQCLKLEFSY